MEKFRKLLYANPTQAYIREPRTNAQNHASAISWNNVTPNNIIPILNTLAPLYTNDDYTPALLIQTDDAKRWIPWSIDALTMLSVNLNPAQTDMDIPFEIGSGSLEFQSLFTGDSPTKITVFLPNPTEDVQPLEAANEQEAQELLNELNGVHTDEHHNEVDAHVEEVFQENEALARQQQQQLNDLQEQMLIDMQEHDELIEWLEEQAYEEQELARQTLLTNLQRRIDDDLDHYVFTVSNRDAPHILASNIITTPRRLKTTQTTDYEYTAPPVHRTRRRIPRTLPPVRRNPFRAVRRKY